MTLEELANEISMCTKCPLHEKRTNAVPGYGDPNADIMFIGEGPGKQEDLQGKPFVGAAGKFLDELLTSINMDRSQVFIANTVKCRPPNNRDPETIEKETCWPYLEAQIQCIKPRLICLLGRHALERFIPGLRISAVHGDVKIYRGFHQEKQPYLPLYHPAAALYNGGLRSTLKYDFSKIPHILKKLTEMGY